MIRTVVETGLMFLDREPRGTAQTAARMGIVGALVSLLSIAGLGAVEHAELSANWMAQAGLGGAAHPPVSAAPFSSGGRAR